ncbi:TetR/AcrR family transcriptional regulator C-terminal domain-containing protein [Actinoplanes sp. LDG1-06]|uniref:TetR/AcrR family transcriptional regulator C-terminal domain-containing protein n=1 Tax=Paractinoplanes ovalisporus TaxID=2810368 RepID=A0ABS2A8W5_9ACTN|nr:TetR/AcrR family transcriptional regulator C-terminal domain-containing protein [Actinoplanes ovalisporus]MBM2615758.1 TetR/AcrR family transcriptional regulator C-terminal domain-containing protein [Actinoplanes ovalisporus]
MSEQQSRIPVWAREDTRRRTTLSREAIVAAAIAVADAEGLDAVSIRRVATDLAARAMSLYTYIERKEDLFDLMADEVAAETLVAGELPPDWREATLAIARLERATTLRHPWLVDLVTRRSVHGHVGPNMLRHSEMSIAALDSLDADLTWKWRLMTAVADYATGFAIREIRERDAAAAGETEEIQTYLRRLADGGNYPHLAALLDGGRPDPGDDNFERGLNWLMDGFARELDRP